MWKADRVQYRVGGRKRGIMKSEISDKNPYYIPKHRYYELLHFCKQYPMWQDAFRSLSGLSHRPEDLTLFKTNEHGDPTERCAESALYYFNRIEMVNNALIEAGGGGELSYYMYYAVIEGKSYDQLNAKYDVGISRDAWYNLYRKFFWILSQTRN